jgi:hypothetical protein
MRKISLAAASLSFLMLPSLAFALPGVGNRLTIAGTIQQVTLTEQQRFDQWGGEVVVKATNGQNVTVLLQKGTKIISEGRTSRKKARPIDLNIGMTVRITGLRLSGDSLSASVVVITNVERNPVLAANGIITAVGDSSITILQANGQTQTYSLNIDTQVVAEYSVYGKDGLTFVGKQALITLNPDNEGQAKIIRVREASRRNAPDVAVPSFQY